jgi:hypothetical protein
MINSTAVNLRRWPRLLQRSAAGLIVVIVLALLYVLLAGSPQPIGPAKSLFAPVSVDQALSSSRPVLSSFDFIFRPLFAIKRVPPEMPLVDGQQDTSIDELPSEEVVTGIDGVSLLGIFGSGEVAGVIIRLDNGERQRLPVGESVKGWTLQSLGSRRAMLRAMNGQQAVLEMAFATDQAPADVMRAAASEAAASSSNGVKAEPSQQDSTTDAADVVPQRTTFDGIYGGANRSAPDEQE